MNIIEKAAGEVQPHLRRLFLEAVEESRRQLKQPVAVQPLADPRINAGLPPHRAKALRKRWAESAAQAAAMQAEMDAAFARQREERVLELLSSYGLRGNTVDALIRHLKDGG